MKPLVKEEMSDSFTNYNHVGNTKLYPLKKLSQQMHIKRDISNWNIKITIGAGNPDLLSTICLLSATI